MSDLEYIEDPAAWSEKVTEILLDAAAKIDAISTEPGKDRWYVSRCLLISERLTPEGPPVISGWNTNMPISDQMGMCHALQTALEHDLLAGFNDDE